MRCAIFVFTTLLLSEVAWAQDRPVSWQRSDETPAVPVTVFHSTHSVNLPTAETLQSGEWLFEVSHRFLPTLSEGHDALWGLDGPVFNRLGLAYAVSNRLLVGILRSNLDDNLELDAKVRVWETRFGSLPFMVGAMGGVAWNTQAEDVGGRVADEMQAYAQLILNTKVGDKLALGIVPTVLHNPRIDDVEAERAVVLGVNGQVYLSAALSVLAEWVISEGRLDSEHNAGTFGIELETGGHFFKIVLTNTARLNPTQFLAGTPYEFKPDEWRLGFNVTRLLKFW